MANTTPLVATVTKPTNNPGEANTAPRFNIQELCEEYYEDILPIIMEKARHERLKDVHARLDFGEGVEKASATLKNHTVILSPTPIVTKVVTIQKEETGLRHPARQGAIQAKEKHRAARVWFDELPPESIDGYKDMKASFLSYFMQQKKYVKDSVEIHNIKQRDGETLEDFMERFKIETGRMKGAPECMRISGFMHGINNPDDYITDGVQQRDYMAARTAKTPSDHRRRHPFYQSIDELHDYEVVVTLQRSLLIPAECASVDTSSVTPREKKTHPTNLTVTLHPNFPDQEVVVGGSLSDRGRTELCTLLKKNLDIFAWQPSDMTGVPRSIAEHRLNIQEGCPPIDWKVESLCGYPFKCFLDAYTGYHQIQLAAADEEKTAFHTRQRVYCYTKMLFGLKNDGATYQRLMDKAFKSQMGKNIEVYVDDLVVKSHTEAEMVRGIEETLQTLRKINMKLNPKKDLPLLAAPKPQEELIMYLSATHGAISAVLMTEQGTAQMPVYFISRALQGPELNYSPMEKLVLSMVFASKRLRRYFQAHPITVITDQPIKQFMSHPEWQDDCKSNTSQGVSVAVTQEEPWTLFTDGSPCIDGSGAGLILTNPEEVEFTYALRFQFATSNNKAEYKALIVGLRIATQIGVKNIQANVDSKLVANQVLGTYVAKEDNMIKYMEIAKGLVSGFKTFSISQVPQSRNKKADALSKIASTSFAHLSKQVLVEVLETKSITGKEVTAVIEKEGPTWMMKLVNYLKEGILPGDENEAWKLRFKARQYELMEGVLYKRSFLTPWLRCVGPLQAEYVMREIHEGSCSMHAGPRSVVAKAIRLGYFWPTMHKDERDMIRKCSDCQIHRNRHSRPLSRRAREGQVPDSRNGLLYEVDRSKIGGNDYRRTGEEICMEQYCMPLRVRGVAFKPGDFVYRSNDASHAVAGSKLGPKWEGPYEVTEALGNGAYKLRSTDGTVLPRT
nr:reverse transcriptase domain-containing protein [Tanacetum cinerariifolium]